MGTSAPLLLRASAGTGKTHALVEEYVRLVTQEGLSPTSIVAITFTRKAAGELTRRIDVRMRQAGVSEACLAELARAPIGNFHALAMRWLDADGYLHLKTPLDDALGEHEDESLFRLAVHEAWFGPQSLVREDVEYVAEGCRLDEGLTGELWTALKRAREDGQEIDASLLGAPYDGAAMGARAQASMSSLFQRIVDEQDNTALLTSAKAQLLAKRIAAMSPPAAYQPSAAWQEQWLRIWKMVNLSTKISNVITKEERDAAKAWPSLCDAEERCQLLQPRWQRLILAAWQTYTREKETRRVYDFADALALATSRMQEHVALHEQMRTQIAAVLVDEAQDVSPVQRTLLHLLVGERGPAKDIAPKARLFVVGDWKQCIYGFRGADAQMFARISDDVLSMGGQDASLTTNYRSNASVVEGINAIGRHLFAAHYEAIEARQGLHATLPDAQPAMAWWTIDDERDEQGEEPAATTSARAEAEGCARLVRQAVEQGRAPGRIAILCQTLSKHASNLTRALSEQGIPSIVVSTGSLFEQLDVRQLLSLGAWLSAPNEQMALPLAAALRSAWCDVSDDALYALLGAQGRQQGALAAFARGDAAPWLACLPSALRDKEASALESVTQSWHAASIQLRQIPVSEAMEWLDAHLHITARIWRSPRATQWLANWHRLVAMAERDEARGEANARAFWLRHYGRMQRGEYEAEGRLPGRAHNAVTISTVHSAKGLEWEHVLLPLLSRQPRSDTDSVLFDREEKFVFKVRAVGGPRKSARFDLVARRRKDAKDEEVKRLLYVATTRAREHVDFLECLRPPHMHGNFAKHLHPLGHASPTWLSMAGPVPQALLDVWKSSAGDVDDKTLAHRPDNIPHVLRTSVSMWLSSVLSEEDEQQLDPAEASTQSDAEAQSPQAQLLASARKQRISAQRGIVAHATLAACLSERWPQPMSVDAWNARVQSQLARQGLDAHAEPFANIGADLAALCSDPLVQQLAATADGDLAVEWPFRLREMTEQGSVDLEGTADVVARLGDALWLLDWKWRKTPATGRRHRLQLYAYAMAARRALGWTGPVHCAVIHALAKAGERVTVWPFDEKAEAECRAALVAGLSAQRAS